MPVIIIPAKCANMPKQCPRQPTKRKANFQAPTKAMIERMDNARYRQAL